MLEHTREQKGGTPPVAGPDRPDNVSFDRRTAELAMLGLGTEAAVITDKIDGDLLTKMARSYAGWLQANENPVTDIFDERWSENLAARVSTPGVIAMIQMTGIDDDAAREKLGAAIADDPDSRVYGGMHGSFVARTSPQGMARIARLEEVVKIS